MKDIAQPEYCDNYTNIAWSEAVADYICYMELSNYGSLEEVCSDLLAGLLDDNFIMWLRWQESIKLLRPATRSVN